MTRMHFPMVWQRLHSKPQSAKETIAQQPKQQSALAALKYHADTAFMLCGVIPGYLKLWSETRKSDNLKWPD